MIRVCRFILVAVSLLLALAFTVLCVRSFWSPDLVQSSRHAPAGPLADTEETVQLSNGYAGATRVWARISFLYPSPAEAARARSTSGYIYNNRFYTHHMIMGWNGYGGGNYGGWQILGFSWTFWGPSATSSDFMRRITLPYPALMLLFALYPAWVLRAVRRARRARLRIGHCPTCDYDLRGSSERCPECGTPKAVPSSAPAPP